jgi:hypothetical protein
MKRILLPTAMMAALCALIATPALALTWQDVGAMKHAGIADNVITEKILFSCQVFHLEADDIAQLKAAGVSDAIIHVMRRTESDLVIDSDAIAVPTYHASEMPIWAYPDMSEPPAPSYSDNSNNGAPGDATNSGYGYGYGGYYGSYSSGYYYPHYRYGYYGVSQRNCGANYRHGGGQGDQVAHHGGGNHSGGGGNHGGGGNQGAGGNRGWVGYQGGGAQGGAHGGGSHR